MQITTMVADSLSWRSFRVADTDPETPVVDPTTLKLPGPETFREEATKTTRQMSLETTTLNGLDTHLLARREVVRVANIGTILC